MMQGCIIGLRCTSGSQWPAQTDSYSSPIRFDDHAIEASVYPTEQDTGLWHVNNGRTSVADASGYYH